MNLNGWSRKSRNGWSRNGWSRKVLLVLMASVFASTLFFAGLSVKLVPSKVTQDIDAGPVQGQVYWDNISDFKLSLDVGVEGASADWAWNVYWYNCNYDTWCGSHATGNCCAGTDITAIVQNQCNGAVYYGSTQHMFTSYWGQQQDFWFGDATGGYCYRIIGFAYAGESSQRQLWAMQGGY